MTRNIEDKLKEFADSIREQAKEALCDFESDVLPYVEDDTIMNAQIQAIDIVENILKGRFEWDGGYILVNSAREFSPRVRLAFSTTRYDQLRDNIIARMPECPKDAKIKALEEELNRAYSLRSIYG